MGYPAPSFVASGLTFAQLQAKGFSGHIEALISTQAVTLKPTAAGTIATGTTSGGSLAPGAYLLNFTETNGIGETLPSAESASFTLTAQSAPAATATGAGSSSGSTLPPGAYIAKFTYVDANGETGVGTSVSATITTTGTQILTITFNDGGLPAGITSRNVYLTAAGGAAGTATLYATGVTTATYVANSGSWTNGTTTQAAAVLPPTVNTTTTNQPVVTFPALQTGNIGRNLYLTAPGGATGTETLYKTGITTTTYTMVGARPNGAAPLPTTNSTALSTSGKTLDFIRSENARKTDRIFERARTVIYDYLRGAPVSQSEALARFREAHSAIALYNAAMTEMGVLIDANPGHFVYMQTGAGTTGQRRVWP